MKIFIAKRIVTITQFEIYSRLKLPKNKEYNKNICDAFDHNFKNIHLYITIEVSFERHYFLLYKMVSLPDFFSSKMAMKTLHINYSRFTYVICEDYGITSLFEILSVLITQSRFFCFCFFCFLRVCVFMLADGITIIANLVNEALKRCAKHL